MVNKGQLSLSHSLKKRYTKVRVKITKKRPTNKQKQISYFTWLYFVVRFVKFFFFIFVYSSLPLLFNKNLWRNRVVLAFTPIATRIDHGRLLAVHDNW